MKPSRETLQACALFHAAVHIAALASTYRAEARQAAAWLTQDNPEPEAAKVAALLCELADSEEP